MNATSAPKRKTAATAKAGTTRAGATGSAGTRPAGTRAGKARAAKARALDEAARISPDLPIRLGSTPATPLRADPGLFGRLLEDHDKHRALLSMIEQTAPRDPRRQQLFASLVREIKGHAAAEEQALWSTVLRAPATTDVARHAIAEHKKLDDRFADLAARDSTARGWLRRFSAMKEEYLHHIREEEQEQFVRARTLLSPADARHLRGVFERRKREERAAAKVEKKIERD